MMFGSPDLVTHLEIANNHVFFNFKICFCFSFIVCIFYLLHILHVFTIHIDHVFFCGKQLISDTWKLVKRTNQNKHH
jgi:hypothetical protein